MLPWCSIEAGFSTSSSHQPPRSSSQMVASGASAGSPMIPPGIGTGSPPATGSNKGRGASLDSSSQRSRLGSPNDTTSRCSTGRQPLVVDESSVAATQILDLPMADAPPDFRVMSGHVAHVQTESAFICSANDLLGAQHPGRAGLSIEQGTHAIREF